MPKVAIVGITSWGITIGLVLASKGTKVSILTRTEQESSNLQKGGLSSGRFPINQIPANLTFTHDTAEAMKKINAVVLPVPSQTMRTNIQSIKSYLNDNTLIISAAKGLEIGTRKRMSQVIAEEIEARFRRNICVMSGPNLAREIVQGLPAATVAAAEDKEISREVQRLLTTPKLCVFTHNDVIGVELGGALKNIIALGAGIADGLGYGDNAKAAFITRGLTEITALGTAMGAHPLTFSGLAGLGDVIATCASTLSRNHYMGVELTKNRSVKEITATMDGIAEGVTTTKVAWDIAQSMGMGLPITEKMYRVIYEGLAPAEAAKELMGASVEHELTGRKWTLFSFLSRRGRK